MLKQLYIKNYALIDELDIQFHKGFTVITGETGAGKSIILGAISLLLGQRANNVSIRNKDKKCIIEAHFNISQYHIEQFFNDNDLDYDAEETILRREIGINGKSRAFINDVPVSVTLIRELGDRLIDIHSQHQNLLLNKQDFQLGVVDIIGNDKDLLTEYQHKYKALKDAEEELISLESEIAANKENEEFLRFQFNKLSDANLQPDEQELLEQESETMSHTEEIKSALYETSSAMNGDDTGALELIRTSLQKIESITSVYPAINSLSSRLESCYIELKDIVEEIDSNLENVEFNPLRLEEINNRLDLIYTLQNQFHVATNEELINIKDGIEQQLSHIDYGEEEISRQKEKVKQLKDDCLSLAAQLTAARKEAAKRIETAMTDRLVPLGMPNVRFKVFLQSKDLSANGVDVVSFMFSANKNEELHPVSQTASGGEIARVMLSLKAMISGAVNLPTIIFDEIDTGVSGRVAEQMAQIMAEMGEHERQVISITHLPQIAAKGTFHYKVVKEETSKGTNSQMFKLNQSERVQEIAQMLSGSDVSLAALDNAKALLKIE